MKIIQKREVYWEEVRERFFQWSHLDRHCGFGFPCDEDGNVNESQLKPAGLDNFRKCIDGTHDVIDMGVKVDKFRRVIPKMGLCKCGEEVCLESFTNTCSCGRDYNMCGQELAPRSQWGMETGEHWSDIVNFNPEADYSEDW